MALLFIGLSPLYHDSIFFFQSIKKFCWKPFGKERHHLNPQYIIFIHIFISYSVCCIFCQFVWYKGQIYLASVLNKSLKIWQRAILPSPEQHFYGLFLFVSIQFSLQKEINPYHIFLLACTLKWTLNPYPDDRNVCKLQTISTPWTCSYVPWSY